MYIYMSASLCVCFVVVGRLVCTKTIFIVCFIYGNEKIIIMLLLVLSDVSDVVILCFFLFLLKF